ncbi:ketopantoate reductase family protein [Phototrophicus methaneseepsis]|uniref:2-dehydropantoate 2-reductase n=1 Tax=Phototrophicus methaneseepsis TaxID=2710758 RepID=A0A7S8ECV8_9CHLR|nr:ketopantoate reductase family protein [Phototrophicus methaneseepsis]QPC84640.1 ketopantoate reductase family protein [Phototrophicus methaneseepsis]
MNDIQHIAIQGMGAMGTMYAGVFMETGFDVSIIATGARAQALKEKGFTLNGQHYAAPVKLPGDHPDPADLIIVALKQHHMEVALPDLAPFVGPGTIILSVMNGLDSEPALAAAYPQANVLYCMTVAMTPQRVGRDVTYTSLGRLTFGEAQNNPLSDDVKRVQAAFDKAGIAYDTPEDMVHAMWWKFMVNTGVNQASAVMRATYHTMRTSPEAQTLMLGLMHEVIDVASAEGITLTEDDIQDFQNTLAKVPADDKTSMLQDVEAGRPNEVDLFAGRVLQLGEKHNIDTPYNRTVYYILRVLGSTN